MKLTHCDLFFADATILVEGNVERLLLPIMIEKSAKDLKSKYLSILEIGGAFAHVFRELVHFLGLTTLVITDLDSVVPTAQSDEAATGAASDGIDGDLPEEAQGQRCTVETPGAITSNQTLINWIPKLVSIADLLNATPEMKAPAPTGTESAKVCVAYQTRRPVKWNGEERELAGRTLEEAFACENLTWCQDVKQKALHLRVVKNKESPELNIVTQRVYARVGSGTFDKTDFALALIMTDPSQWDVPHYIAEGLTWLSNQLASAAPVTEARAEANP
jgi:predicted ATP-dependent endonuclease of OLD family